MTIIRDLDTYAAATKSDDDRIRYEDAWEATFNVSEYGGRIGEEWIEEDTP